MTLERKRVHGSTTIILDRTNKSSAGLKPLFTFLPKFGWYHKTKKNILLYLILKMLVRDIDWFLLLIYSIVVNNLEYFINVKLPKTSFKFSLNIIFVPFFFF